MNAITASESIRDGLKQTFPDSECFLFPMADGGDGSLMVAKYHYRESKILETIVKGPMAYPVKARMLMVGETSEVFIEMAEASGIMRVDQYRRNPLMASTYGVGEMLLSALKTRPEAVVIALGGSVTNDGGMGFLEALGVDFLDRDGNVLPGSGESLQRVSRIENGKCLEAFANTRIIVLADVKNPLLGKSGATYTYGGQKGADRAMIDILEKGMENYADVMERHFGKTYRDAFGSGAAGGLGFALRFLPVVEVVSGFDWFAKLSDVEQFIASCDIVFTGEGSLDSQSLEGKVVSGIASLAKKYNKPVIAFTGRINCRQDELALLGLDRICTINDDSLSLSENLQKGPENLFNAAKKIGHILSESISE